MLDIPATAEFLLTPDQVCKALQISRSTFDRLVHEGELPAVKVGRSVRVDPDELVDYIYGKEQP